MIDRMQVFSKNEIGRIHRASMEILAETGVKFHSDEALRIFRRKGFKTDGKCVFINENQVGDALDQAPSRFKIHARDPEKSVAIGRDDFVLLPTGGAPNVMGPDGVRRAATFADYHDCCRLIQTSDQLDMCGFLMIQPMDLPVETAHLDLLLSGMLMCDKPYLGDGTSRRGAVDSLEMAAIAWGGKSKLKRRPAMAAIITASSPLKYPAEEADSIIQMARLRQPLVITNLVQAGTSGPISLPGLLALANAEILAGLVLAQLVGPGTPVVYASVSAPADMRTVTSAVGAPEAVVLVAAVLQMAQYYHLPCRTGGMLTNSHCPDAQAAAEGTLIMSTAVRNGANFILHACGQLGSYLSMSFEKWLLDEEVCRMLRRVLTTMEVTVESIDVETIKSVGSDGNYLTHPTTFRHCRDLYQPVLFTRADYQKWRERGTRRASDTASEMLPRRMETYRRPPVDEGLEQELRDYVARRKREIG